jgi:AraC-like DNA-binding protein
MDNRNFFLYERSRQHFWRGAGLLSIKSFSGGTAHYDIGQGAFRVDDSAYLVLNHGQEYTITLDSETEVASFCVFFASGFAEQVYGSLTQSPETLLDSPGGETPLPLFFQRTYGHDPLLSPVLALTRESYTVRQAEPGWLEERYHTLMQQLLVVHEHVRREVAALPAIRAATREELYRRIHLARDYLTAAYDQPLTLDQLAQVASLSPNHLLRTFKQAFGQTPHQFLTDVRLRQARHLLTTTQHPITAICLDVGFESPSSFSWLFRRRFGTSPQAFRQLNRNG